MKIFNLIKKLILQHPTVVVFLIWVSLVVVGSYVFYLRYPYAYAYANFYAEDGTVFLRNIIDEGPIRSVLSLFNGYLVIGQYMLIDFAMIINSIFGRGFETIPKAIAIVSYLFFGLVSSLPFVLFRKKIGTVLSLLAVSLLVILPIGGYDYAVIGTIGNLKFSFLFIAAMLIIYRNDKDLVNSKYRLMAVDISILICILTNIVSVVLLPFALFRYRSEMWNYITGKNRKKILNFGSLSLIILLSITLLYMVAISFVHPPKMAGYLDEPMIISSLINIFSRGSIYGLLFPVNFLLNDSIVLFFTLGILMVSILSRHRLVLSFLLIVMIVNVLAFVLNRPGVTHLFTSYSVDGGPGLFFYAGTMTFVIWVVFAIQDWFKIQSNLSKAIISLLVIGFIVIVAPLAGSRGASYKAIISKRPTLSHEIDRVCNNYTVGGKVELGVYPAENWTITMDRDLVCKK